MLLLEILGAILLLIVIVVAWFGWRFYRGVKSHLADNSDFYTLLSVLPPLSLNLAEGSSDAWRCEQRRADDEQALLKAGFTHAGYFTTELGQAVVQISLWNNPQKAIAAALMEAQLDDEQLPPSYAADVFVQFADGDSLTLSNNQDAGVLSRPPQHRLVVAQEDKLNDMFKHLKPNVAPGKKVRAVKNIKASYIELFEQNSDWLWQAEQLRGTKMQALAQTLNIELNNELIADLLSHARREKSERICEAVVQRVAQAKNLSVSRWEQIRDRLVVVHDAMHAEDISDCLMHLLPELDDSQHESLEAFSQQEDLQQPLAVFMQYLEQLAGTKKPKRIAHIKSPVEAMVYIEPE